MRVIIFFLLIMMLFISCAEHKINPVIPENIILSKQIDNFDDNNYEGYIGGVWATEKDSDDCRISKQLISGYNKSTAALKVRYTLNVWCNINLDFGKMNLIEYDGIRILVIGSRHKLRIDVCTENVTDDDWYGFNIERSPSIWTEYIIPFSSLTRIGFGTQSPVPGFMPSQMFKLQIKVASEAKGEKGWFAIDDIYFYKVD